MKLVDLVPRWKNRLAFWVIGSALVVAVAFVINPTFWPPILGIVIGLMASVVADAIASSFFPKD